MNKKIDLPEAIMKQGEPKDIVHFCAVYLQAACARMSNDIANQNMYALCSESVNIKNIADTLAILDNKMNSGQKDTTVI